MARGKYEAKKHGTAGPPAEASRGVGLWAGDEPLEAAASPAPGGRADLPALGIVVMSPWGWRILAVAAMVAVGLCVTFLLDGHTAIGGIWAFIAVAWSLFTVRLWRMHLTWDLGH